MLPQDKKDELQRLGFDVEKLESAVKSDQEESIDIPTLKTSEEFEKMVSEDDKNTFGNNRFDEGKKAMSEIKAKELKEKFGIEVEGKNLDNVIEAYASQKATAAGKKPEEWEAEKKQLQQTIQSAETKLSEKETEFSQKLANIELRNQVLSLIPEETSVPKQDLVDLFSLRYRVAQEDGRTVIYKGSDKLQDNRLEPLELKEVVTSFIDEGQYVKNPGMGGGDGSGSSGGSSAKFKSLKEYEAYCEKEGLNPASEEANKILRERKDEAVSDEEFYNAKVA